MLYFCSMCTVTLSYNENDTLALQQLAMLLSTGHFVRVGDDNDKVIDYTDPSLYEECAFAAEDKEYYTPEELRKVLISDLNEVYGVEDAV